MNEYWVGVFIGFFISVFFMIVCMFVFDDKCELREDFEDLKAEHDQIDEWISDNETIMRTYEFFNENITKLVEGRKENAD